jgi:transposase
VGVDLHRRRSVIVRMTQTGEVVEEVRIDNDPVALACAIEKADPGPEVVLEATYGWYWAADVLSVCGARVHLAHPLGVKGFTYRRVKTTSVTHLILLTCCAWAACPKPGSLHQKSVSSESRALSRLMTISA